MKALIKFLVSFSLVAVVFTACGGGSGSSDTSVSLVSNTVLAEINKDTNLTGSLVFKNNTSTSYDYNITADVNGSVMKTGSLVSSSSSASGEYTFPVDINLTAISEGNYTLNSEITGAGAGYSLGHKFVIISTPTISLADQTVNDNGGGLATNLPAPTVTNVQSGAVYSIVNNTVTGLTINSSTGVMTYDNNINGSNSFNVTVKVTNQDGGSDTATFTLNVTDNG